MIIHAGKDIENRTWRTNYRGRILIHASKGCTGAEYSAAVQYAESVMGRDVVIPPLDELKRGGIIGSAEITECVEKSRSPWFMGKYGLVLVNPLQTEFRPYKGRLGIFDVTDAV